MRPLLIMFLVEMAATSLVGLNIHLINTAEMAHQYVLAVNTRIMHTAGMAATLLVVVNTRLIRTAEMAHQYVLAVNLENNPIFPIFIIFV